jgi:hypothetical protein
MSHYLLTIPNELSAVVVAVDGKLVNPFGPQQQNNNTFTSSWIATAQRIGL